MLCAEPCNQRQNLSPQTAVEIHEVLADGQLVYAEDRDMLSIPSEMRREWGDELICRHGIAGGPYQGRLPVVGKCQLV